MRDKAIGKGILLVDKFDRWGYLQGQAKAENLWVVTGIDEVLRLMAGIAASPWNNADALIGVGDDATVANDAQADLLAAVNKDYQPMMVGFPATAAPKTMSWRATFGAGDANFAWNEFTLKNNATGICVNRGVQALGVKVGGAVWIATLTLSLS